MIKKFNIKIKDIKPQQHYLSKFKLDEVNTSFHSYESYGEIYVISYRGQFFSIDGHHRLYLLYKKGVEELEVVNDIEDNDNELYQILADEAIHLGINTIGDLGSRVIETEEEFQEKWIDKCQNILRELDRKSQQ